MAAAKDLRYPYAPIHETTDYLSIQIRTYVPSRFSTQQISRESEYIIGDAGQTNAANDAFIYKQGSPATRYTNTVSNRAQLGVGDVTAQFQPNGRSNIGDLIDTIYLPIPSNIQDGNSVTFGPGEMDGLTAQTLGVINKAFADARFDNLAQVAGELVKDAAKIGLSGPSKEYFLNTIAAGAANIPFGGNLTAAQILARETGKILNPNMELLFSGVNLRSFKFSFKMTPRSKTEAEKIRDIIKTLKQNMSPKEDGVYLGSPNVFQLEYKKGTSPHPFLHRFKECALTDMSVNYTGEGTYATYSGDLSAPVSMIMDLGFKELEPIYSSDYGSEEGVGY